jgi:DNA-binding response OmpR family regulator
VARRGIRLNYPIGTSLARLKHFLKILSPGAEGEDAMRMPESSSAGQDDAGAVLLAVEEQSIGRMLSGVFKRAGMNVLWMGGLGPSLAWLRENPTGVSRAFVDCPCVRDDIVDFCMNALAVRPGLQVLLAGGADTRATVEVLSAHGTTLFIPKPYLPTELAWQLRAQVLRPQAA